MIGKLLDELDTPSLLINLDQMERNLVEMQKFADCHKVKLRPHTKTHKSAEIAHQQLEYGAKGITVAKVSEAEAMANAGITDIFIATEVVGKQKLHRLKEVVKKANVRLAVDSLYHVEQLIDVAGVETPIQLMLEIDTGQGRCGVIPDKAVDLAEAIIARFPHKLAGIFTHEGHVYNAASLEEMKIMSMQAQTAVIDIVNKLKAKWNMELEVSIGCTLSQLTGGILPGITEIRPGTYVFHDVGHAFFRGSLEYCAGTVLATITTKKSHEQVVADTGAKAMTIDQRSSGVLKTEGFGKIKGYPDLLIQKLSDEHAVIVPGDNLSIGDRIEIIPNHICPTVNLYDRAYGIREGRVEKVFTISARGCTQ